MPKKPRTRYRPPAPNTAVGFQVRAMKSGMKLQTKQPGVGMSLKMKQHGQLGTIGAAPAQKPPGFDARMVGMIKRHKQS